MAGSYLKSLQLAKQLEERAKEAAKNKELAEKEYESLQAFLGVCKQNDVDLKEVETLLQEFNAAIGAKDYPTALAQARKAQEAAKNAYIHRIGDVADSVDALVNLIQPQGKESKGALDLLEKSKGLVVKDDLEGAMKFAKSAFDAAERAVHEYFSGLLSQAQDIIIQSKEMGEDVGLYEDQIARAKSSVERQDYEPGIAQIREAIDGAGESVKSQITAAIARAEEMKSAGEELSADMSRVSGNIDKARKALDQLRFKEALAYAKRGESEGENVISVKFQELSREAREGIKKLKSVNEDATIPQELLDQATSAMKEKKYIEALHALTSAREKTQGIQFQSVLEVISKARDKFVLAKKVGVDMTKAITLLNTARDNLKLGKFEDAIRYAEQSQKEIDEALEVFYAARDQLVELAKAIKFATDLGADVSEPKAMLADAKKSFESKDYQDTTRAVKSALERARKVAYDKTVSTIDQADAALKLGKTANSDITEAEALLQAALASMSKEDLPEALRLAKESLAASNSAMSRTFSDRVQNLEVFIKGYSGTASLSDAAELVERVKAHVAAAEFAQAQELLAEVTQKIESSGKEECERLISAAEERIKLTASMDVEVSDLEILLLRAKEAKDQKVFDGSCARAKEVIEHSTEMMMRAVQAEFSAIKDPIEEAKAIGIDVDSTKVVLREARVKAEAEDYPESHRLLKQARELLRSKIAKHDGVKAKVSRAEELLAEASKGRADISGLTRRLEQARLVFSNGDIDAADESLSSVISDAEKNLAMYLAARFILSSKETIDLAQAHGIDAGDAMRLLSTSKDLMKRKSYEEALDTAKRCDETARSTITNAMNEMIKDLQRLLTDAKNVGVDTLGPEKLAEKASELLRTGDLSESLKCIESAKSDIDHVRNLSAQSAAEIRTARGNLKDAETLDMEVGQARELLEQAVEALTRHQYAIALELARKSSEASAEVTRTRIRDTLDKLKERVEKAASEGAMLGMAERCVSEGLDAFSRGRYQDALKLAMKCETEMERAELQREVSTKAVETVRRKLEDAAAEGIKIRRVMELVALAERHLSEGRYVEALSTAIESGDELHMVGERLDSARIELSAVKEQVERLKKVNIDASECDEMLEIAHDYMQAYEFEKCSGALKRCSAKALSLFESSIRDVMNQNKEMIAKAKAMGIDTKACENLQDVANTSFSEKLWDFAYQQAQACRIACNETMGKKMDNLVRDIHVRMEELTALGASVRPIEDMIDEARQANEAGDSNVSFQILMGADQRIMAVEDAHKQYTDISIAAESAIETLRRFGIPTRESERLLALADIEKEKDYDSAIEFVAEALDTAKTLIESYSPDISGTITTPGLQEGKEGEISIKLKNVGRALAKDVEVEVQGDFEVVELSALELLRPNAEDELAVKIIPARTGPLTVRATVTAKRQFDGRLQTYDFQGNLSVFAPGPPFKIARATDVNKCVSCQGRIKPGFDIVSCRCGSQLHLACAKRVAQCPVCGQKYTL